MNIGDLGQLAIGGMPVAMFVFLIVQALKWSGMLKNGDQTRVAVLAISVVGSAIWGALELFPQIANATTILFQALIGIAVATLAYEGLERVRSGQGI